MSQINYKKFVQNNLHMVSMSVAKPLQLIPVLFFLSCHNFLLYSQEQQPSGPLPPNITGVSCTVNQTSNPCQTYVFYRAVAPNFLDLASIGDLFSVSRVMISEPSNISSPYAPLIPNQPLFVPITCSCNRVNNKNISYASISFTIKKDDTFYVVSTSDFGNLTTFQSVEQVNPTLVPTNLTIGVKVIFPIFCKCPSIAQSQNQINYLVSYVFQPSDNLSLVASRFAVAPQSITGVNGNNIQPYDTIFIPVTQLPRLARPTVVTSTPPSAGSSDRKGTVTGLAIGLGVTGFLLILVTGMLIYKLVSREESTTVVKDEEKQKQQVYGGVKEHKGSKDNDLDLLANVSDYLDKYRVFEISELLEATDGFHENYLIQGSVYKGSIDGEMFAIKKMKWNAYEELKILQKVNHGNLVKLEGFCIDQEGGSCYLVYEYVENGSLYSWLHDKTRNEKLSWKARLKIAVDIANGLQYIHEHTRPRVVHKDVKSSHVLLDSSMRAKISNFGLAKSGCNAITMHIVGTQGYIAPEYLADGVVSMKMDVFAFGVVLLELISGQEAIDEAGNVLWARAVRSYEVNEKDKVTRVREWLDESLVRNSCSMESVSNVMNVAVACLHKDPAKRPSMVDIVYALCRSDDAGFDISDDGIGTPLVMAR